MTVKQLESAAVRAHARGVQWKEFFVANGEAIRNAVARDRFPGFYRRLFCLCVSGDLDGIEPIGSDECQWERDDEASKPDDVATAAKWQGSF